MNTPPQTPQPVLIAPDDIPQLRAAASTALVLEIIFGLFGLLGLGHAWSGRLALAIAVMLGWWLWLTLSAAAIRLTNGLAVCLCLPVYIAIPVLSGIQARAWARRAAARGSFRSVGCLAGAGCLTLLVVALAVLLIAAAAAV